METLKVIAKAASDYTALINLLLTTVIVMITAWYAVVTRRMWREMINSRLSAIRPLLAIEAEKPELEETETLRTMKGILKIVNFGRGPAYALRGFVSLRYENETEKSWIRSNIQAPVLLSPGEPNIYPFTIPGFPTPMDISLENFLIILFTFQDGEGNYYSLKQVYDLRVVTLSNIVSRTWQLRLDETRFRKFSRRRLRSMSPDYEHSKMDVLISYKLPTVMDWTKQ